MEVDYLIIGQGVCGTFLSHYLQDEGKTCVVIDDKYPNSPSKIAAGIINPVTGRRLVTVWMVEEVLPFAWKAYTSLGQQLDCVAISQKNVIDFFPNPFMREGFLQKIASGDKYVHAFPEQNHFNPYFNYEFGCGEIRPVYTAHLENILPRWRRHLSASNALLEQKFELSELNIGNGQVQYQDIKATKVIFCDGPSGFDNPWFRQLPFAPNKGEALVAEIPGLPDTNIFKKSMMLVPMETPDHFWVGASYVWDFDDPGPTAAFRENTERILRDWLKLPFRIIEHRAGLRPATLERRPFVGLHPLHPEIGILNGMGTKGCSLGPYFARQLTDHLVTDEPIAKDASVRRFDRILSRK